MSSSDGENSYPPQPVIASELAHNQPSPPRIIQRFTKAFCFRRRRANYLSENESPQTSEFGSTTLTSTVSRCSSRPRSRRSFKPHMKGGPNKNPPPLIVPSWRYKAEPQTFAVRSEMEFTVTCTIVQPKSRFHFGWPRWFRFRFWIPGRRSRTSHANGNKTIKKSRRKSRGGVEIEHDVCDDSWSIIEPQHYLRPNSQSLQERRAKTIRRSSGWAGVFSTSETHPGTSASGSDARPSDDNVEGPSFEIDRTSKMLIVPEVDIGVAYSVKREVENNPETVRLVRPRAERYASPGYRASADSENSWLEL